ncbi:MAG: beta-N-acetylhexosaminidase [Bacteroidia bacterium]|jgi:hexosaminidase|nr:beta-N-acetylhexosaminidase [Bacteroidia bacterium]
MKKQVKLPVGLTAVLSFLFLLFAELSIAAQPPVVPLPAVYQLEDGCFALNRPIRLVKQKGIEDLHLKTAAEQFKRFGIETFADEGKALAAPTLRLGLSQLYNKTLGNEGYQLNISSENILLIANTNAGIQYGLNTLGQMLRSYGKDCLPAWQITDYPRFSYRGMHLDVSRHFMPAEFIYRYLDVLAMHRINTFHWHLVDDQGWRLQIDRYPLLTEVGAWREDRGHEHWNLRPLSRHDAPKTYGGFYTKDEVRAIVSYAAERNINIIPEIEMPAHVMSALAAYPEYSCSGQNLGVPPGGVWPITHIYCAGKEETFEFLENVLLEVMELFPSPIIHIGGDEADKTEWKTCELCQRRMAAENLTDVHALQSYFIQRIGRFLEAHGRRLMGWDEILEGGLAENAIVMSWRGEEGGIEAARMHHEVVMTPGSHCYFDHYQGDPATEPLAIGGFTPLDKVYAYEPIPTALNEEQAQYVLGAQANVWTEYMPVPQHVEYMVLPRMAALAEVLWSPRESRSWDGFVQRLPLMLRQYDETGLNYARSAWKVQVKEDVNKEARELVLSMSTLLPVDSLVYVLKGEGFMDDCVVYSQPVRIDKSAKLTAYTVVKGKNTPALIREYNLHKAFGLPVVQQPSPSDRYPGSAFNLTDGIEGTRWFSDGRWSGILDDHWKAEIRFPESTLISEIRLVSLSDPASWIFVPDLISLYASKNGKRFKKVASLAEIKADDSQSAYVSNFRLSFKPGKYKAIRLSAERTRPIPENHPGFGKKVWMFFSEIVAE